LGDVLFFVALTGSEFYRLGFYFLRIKHIHEQHTVNCPHGTNTIYERLQHYDSLKQPKQPLKNFLYLRYE